MTSGSSARDIVLVWQDGRDGTDEREERLSVEENRAILAAAERAGVALPFGCRTGACATCTGRLLDGRIEHARPPRALKERHREAGYVLLCIAEPRSDCRIAVGASVQAELVSNPWR
ncbi:ferredoxin [Halobacteriales archaeon QS_7_68_65]|nr:MAG: ferredoxin [Halobacteriales archaeon QS_7_68_65]